MFFITERNKADIIYSIEKGIRVLEFLCYASEDLSITEISRAFNINKTTIYRILRTFSVMGYVEQDTKSERYRPTMKILTLSNKVLNRMEIRSVANRYLKHLAIEVNQSVHLAVMDYYETVIIDKVESEDAIGINFHIGRRSPLYCTGTGKILLAAMSDSDLNKYLSNLDFRQFTPSTHSDKTLLRQEVEQVRKLDYALDRQEHNTGISCVAAPIRDFSGSVVAAMSATGPSFKIEAATKTLREKVMDTAKTISQRLGYSG
ncbi:MAG: IclR family transcriptional regulator [Desulfitobacteriaceae bacterium]